MSLAHYLDTLNVLGDESRMRLCALLRDRELSVTDLVKVTGIAQSRVSTHLGRLREGGFVRDRREGQHAFYALAEEALPASALAVLDEAVRTADPTLASDLRRLRALESERLGTLPESFAGQMDRQYSPGRTWQSLASGLGALLRMGDVLDVGSGDGAAAATFAMHCKTLTCIDSNPRMVAAAAERFAECSHVSARLADVHALPFHDGAFDAILVFHTLTYAEDPKRALAECARVLRPNGRLVVLSLDKHEQSAITAPYGARHPGFAPRTLRALLSRTGLAVISSQLVCRESKKPHFQVVLAIADKASSKTSTSLT